MSTQAVSDVVQSEHKTFRYVHCDKLDGLLERYVILMEGEAYLSTEDFNSSWWGPADVKKAIYEFLSTLGEYIDDHVRERDENGFAYVQPFKVVDWRGKDFRDTKPWHGFDQTVHEVVIHADNERRRRLFTSMMCEGWPVEEACRKAGYRVDTSVRVD